MKPLSLHALHLPTLKQMAYSLRDEANKNVDLEPISKTEALSSLAHDLEYADWGQLQARAKANRTEPASASRFLPRATAQTLADDLSSRFALPADWIFSRVILPHVEDGEVRTRIYGCNEATYLTRAKAALETVFGHTFAPETVQVFVHDQLTQDARRVGAHGLESVSYSYAFDDTEVLSPLTFDGMDYISFMNHTLDAMRRLILDYADLIEVTPAQRDRFVVELLQADPQAARPAKFFLDRHTDADEQLLYAVMDLLELGENWDQASGEYVDFSLYVPGEPGLNMVLVFAMHDEPEAYVRVALASEDPMQGDGVEFDLAQVPTLADADLDLPAGLSRDHLMTGHADLLRVHEAIQAEPDLAKHFLP